MKQEYNVIYKKKKYVKRNPALEACAGMSIILCWWKIQDSIHDEGFVKSGAYRLLSLFMKRAYRKAAFRLKFHPDDKKIRDEYDLLSLMINEPSLTPEQLRKISVPVLVLVGSHDVIDPEHTKLICASFPDSKLSVIPGGHNIVKTNSQPYIEAVEKFLKKVEAEK